MFQTDFFKIQLNFLHLIFFPVNPSRPPRAPPAPVSRGAIPPWAPLGAWPGPPSPLPPAPRLPPGPPPPAPRPPRGAPQAPPAGAPRPPTQSPQTGGGRAPRPPWPPWATLRPTRPSNLCLREQDSAVVEGAQQPLTPGGWGPSLPGGPQHDPHVARVSVSRTTINLFQNAEILGNAKQHTLDFTLY